MQTVLALSSVTQSYGSHVAVQALDFSLDQGSIGCLLGPSGCGKTTVLRCIAGFEPLVSGEIRISGRVVSRPGHSVPTEQRGVGIVFQDYALFPHLDVEDNVGFGLLRATPAERRKRISELLELVGLADVGKRFPHELSGGQQQRVALARALAPRPQLLLLDEPFSNLDVDLRERLGTEVRQLLKRQNTTALLVTHDQREAFAMADEIGVLKEGSLQQWADAAALYQHPANRFVADFVGQGVFLPANTGVDGQLSTELGPCLQTAEGSPAGTHCDVLLRPEDVVIDEDSPVQARILARTFRGADVLQVLETPAGTQLLCVVPARDSREVGARVGIGLRPGRFNVFPK